mgnify:CR=1 FL=1|jgi:hypothetical protein
MSYDNESIRAISDITKPSTPRIISIVDSTKLQYISLSTLEVTASELGLVHTRVEGKSEDGDDCEFLIVADSDEVLGNWEIELFYTNLFGLSPEARKRYQKRMGLALGYSKEDVQDFLQSEVASTCLCTCCGGIINPPMKGVSWS